MELLQQDGGLEQLKGWPSELALKFERMLMEHHHIFSLDKNEIGCMAPTANYTEVRHFLGMTGFFRRFIKNYAHIAKPLNNILEGEASKLKSEAVTLPPDALDAFKKLKMCCMMAPILAFADFEKEFQLETNVSSEGLGAVLSQKQPDGKWHPFTSEVVS